MLVRCGRRTRRNFTLRLHQLGGWCGLHCAHRATTASPWGLCEHRDHTSCLAIPFSGRAFREHRTNVGALHILFTVRVLRARRMVWLFPPIPSKLARYILQRVAWIGPQLRTSNDHRFIVGVP